MASEGRPAPSRTPPSRTPPSRTQGAVVRKRVVVHGRVQGVWFRDSCLLEARSNEVSGWVRNVEDGTVEAVFEGSPAAVERLVAWCRTGPPAARVDAAEVIEEPPLGESSFAIR